MRRGKRRGELGEYHRKTGQTRRFAPTALAKTANFFYITSYATPEPKNAPLARASGTGSMARYVWGVKNVPPTHVLRF